MSKTRVALFGLIVMSAISLYGCSSGTPTTVKATPTPSSTLSDSNPLIPNNSLNWAQIRDPIMYANLTAQNQSDSGSLTGQPTISVDESKKIGLVASFSRSSKYGVSGTAQIISKSVIQIKDFSYNGLCGELTLGITRANDLKNKLVEAKVIPSATNETFNINIPTNLTLIQFDAIGAYCSNSADPVSYADFQ